MRLAPWLALVISAGCAGPGIATRPAQPPAVEVELALIDRLRAALSALKSRETWRRAHAQSTADELIIRARGVRSTLLVPGTIIAYRGMPPSVATLFAIDQLAEMGERDKAEGLLDALGVTEEGARTAIVDAGLHEVMQDAAAGESRATLRDRLNELARIGIGTPIGENMAAIAAAIDRVIAEDATWSPEGASEVERWVHRLRDRTDLQPYVFQPAYFEPVIAGIDFPFTGDDAPQLLALWDDLRPTRTRDNDTWLLYRDLARNALQRIAGRPLTTREEAEAFVSDVASGTAYRQTLSEVLSGSLGTTMALPRCQALLLLDPARAIADLTAAADAGQIEVTWTLFELLRFRVGDHVDALVGRLATSRNAEARMTAIVAGARFGIPPPQTDWVELAAQELSRCRGRYGEDILFEPLVAAGARGLAEATRVWRSIPRQTRRGLLRVVLMNEATAVREWVASPIFEEAARIEMADKRLDRYWGGTYGDVQAMTLLRWLGLAPATFGNAPADRRGWRRQVITALRSLRSA